jgi:hypothetical protein
MKDRYDFSQAVVGKYLGKIPRDFQIAAETAADKVPEWSNSSVRLMAGNRNPMEVIVEKARAAVLAAMDLKGFTLPVDLFKLAEILSAEIVPKADVRDARTVAGPHDKPRIEYNPTRSPARVRFSICHELGHVLFTDCLQQVRHRSFHTETSPEEYELEMLCNLAAAEFLLPIGSVQEDISKLRLSIHTALDLREKYQASVEAVLLRLAGLSGAKCAVFAAVTDETAGPGVKRHRLEYVKGAQNWDAGVKRGDYLPLETVANGCTAIGFTDNKIEEWVPGHGKLKVEVAAVSPYLNRVMPRIVGLIRPAGAGTADSSPIHLVRGDALLPRGDGEKILAHVVNDQTPNWGAGFGRALQTKWPLAHRQFRDFFEQARGPKLGRTYLSRVTEDILTFQMICQRGYGPSASPRLKYGYLQQCLEQLRDAAIQNNASVHMPKIGTGEAGGSWGMVSNLIAEELCAKGVSVTVYELPGRRNTSNRQGDLFHESHR